MITISDCEAFCDADPSRVRELARRECLGMVQAYALAQESMTGATVPEIPISTEQSVDVDSSYRHAA